MEVIYKNELEHLRLKLDAMQAYNNFSTNKEEVKFIKERISNLKQQIKAAEDNDPEIIKEREQQLKEANAEKQRIAEQKKQQKVAATYNAKRIIIGGIIIVATIGLCIMSSASAQRMHTYVSGLRMGVGMMCLFAGIGLFFLAPAITGKIMSALGAVGVGIGGMLMGIGSTVSSDARNGSPEWVTFGMFLICAGVIIIVGCYWANNLKKK